MKIYEVREKINNSSCSLLDYKFDLNDTWFDTQTFSFAGPMQLQPINRIVVIKINEELNEQSINL